MASIDYCPIFIARIDDVTYMNKVLHELHHADDHSILVITQHGMRIITAGEKIFQVSAYFAASTFQLFKLDTEELNFRFILRDFIETLNLLEGDKIHDGFTGDTSLQIEYKKKGGPLRIRLENKSNYVVSCDLKAFNLPGDTSFRPLNFVESEEIATISLNSKKLYDYVSGLDLISSDEVELVMSGSEIPIKMSTNSTMLGKVELEIPENETEIIKSKTMVHNCLFSFSYKTQFIKPALEALKNSTIMQIKCGSSGLLCIEHFHHLDKPTSMYLILPLVPQIE